MRTLKLLQLILISLAANILYAQPISQSLWGTDGSVNALIKNGNTLYVGGQFTRVAPNIPYGAALNVSTGQANISYPKVNSVVNVVINDGSGGWYIGGDFDHVGGV